MPDNVMTEKEQSTEMKQYRGTEVRVAKENNPCYVARCDRTKGITIHNEDDDETWCLSRKEFLERREYREKKQSLPRNILSSDS